MVAGITPYINTGGSAREAMTTHHDVFGGMLRAQDFELSGFVPGASTATRCSSRSPPHRGGGFGMCRDRFGIRRLLDLSAA